jgi:hypothetical protein
MWFKLRSVGVCRGGRYRRWSGSSGVISFHVASYRLSYTILPGRFLLQHRAGRPQAASRRVWSRLDHFRRHDAIRIDPPTLSPNRRARCERRTFPSRLDAKFMLRASLNWDLTQLRSCEDHISKRERTRRWSGLRKSIGADGRSPYCVLFP